MFDALYPPGLQWYWRADFVNEISDGAIAQHIRFGEALPTMHSTMHMYPIDGAAHDVGPHDTAWSYRDAMYASVFAGVDPDAAARRADRGCADAGRGVRAGRDRLPPGRRPTSQPDDRARTGRAGRRP